jgi:hypothetical protein
MKFEFRIHLTLTLPSIVSPGELVALSPTRFDYGPVANSGGVGWKKKGKAGMLCAQNALRALPLDRSLPASVSRQLRAMSC